MLTPLQKQEAGSYSGTAAICFRHGILLFLICYFAITFRNAATTVGVITNASTASKDTTSSFTEGSTTTAACVQGADEIANKKRHVWSSIANDPELFQTFSNLSFGPSATCQNETWEFCNNYNKTEICPTPTGGRDLWLETPYARDVLSRAHASKNTKTVGCKTLWFAGMSLGLNSQCTPMGGGYQTEYAMALASARINAKHSLQPVLLLSTYGLEGVTTPAEDHSIAKWARSQGAIVIGIDKLSFQDTANWLVAGAGPEHAVGPYLRMDIPRIIQKANLFDLPNVCPRHVMYTDSDVLFVNPITIEDMTVLKSYIAPDKPAYLMYGRESNINDLQPVNTGVFLMDVLRWEKEWEDILRFGKEKEGGFGAFDQGWINEYYNQNAEYQKKVAMLPIAWNWKDYWALHPGLWTDVKILHLHGPKPDRGLWEMASCFLGNLTDQPGPYGVLIVWGVCCNDGSVAHHARKIYELLLPHARSACSERSDLSS